MNDVLEDINNYNKSRNKKVVIIFDDMIADIMRSEKFKAIVKELFIKCRIFLLFLYLSLTLELLKMRD